MGFVKHHHNSNFYVISNTFWFPLTDVLWNSERDSALLCLQQMRMVLAKLMAVVYRSWWLVHFLSLFAATFGAVVDAAWLLVPHSVLLTFSHYCEKFICVKKAWHTTSTTFLFTSWVANKSYLTVFCVPRLFLLESICFLRNRLFVVLLIVSVILDSKHIHVMMSHRTQLILFAPFIDHIF